MPITAFVITAVVGAVSILAPPLVPTVLIVGAVFPVANARISPDVAVLAGVLLALAVQSVRHNGASIRRIVSDSIWLPFVAFAVIAIGSALTNYDAFASPTLVSNTKWYLFRMLAIPAVVVYLALHGESVHCWTRPLVAVGCVLAVLRVLQILGVDITGWLTDTFGLLILSDLRQEGWYNTYASYLALVLPLAIGAAVTAFSSAAARPYWLAAIVLALGFLEVNSRTAIAIITIQMLGWLVICRGAGARTRLATVFGVFAAATVLDPGFVAKNAILLQPSKTLVAIRSSDGHIAIGSFQNVVSLAEGSDTATPSDAEEAARSLAWSAPLVHADHRLRQSVRVPTGDSDPWLYVYVRRAGGGPAVKLVVYVDGRHVADVQDLPDGELDWISMPVPRDAFRQETATIELAADGNLDRWENYIEVVGVSVHAPGLSSGYRNQNWIWDSDLSWAAGDQRGVFLILLDQPTIEQAVLLRSRQRSVLTNSASDRLSLWRAAVDIALKNPWFGTGYYTFGQRSEEALEGRPRFFAYSNAHSAFLQAASDLGFLGLIGFLSILVAVLLIPARLVGASGTRDLQAVALVFAVFSVAVTSLTQTWFVDVRYCLPVWMLFGSIVFLHVSKPGPAARHQ